MSDAAGGQFCTFFLDNHFFGVEVNHVQEVLRYQEMTPVPQAPDTIRGLINLRGQIVTAIDLRRRLAFEPLPEEAKPMNVVVGTDDGTVSFLVDRIGDVLTVDEGQYEAPPETLEGPVANMVTGTYKLEDRLLLVLDTLQATAV
ncbi:MAG: chemotaxis protein CheW [Bradymonadia bacterium]